MAKKVIVVDDLDGSEGDVVTHRFAIDGEYYEIDLCPQNLQDLRAALEPFVRAARRVRKTQGQPPRARRHHVGGGAVAPGVGVQPGAAAAIRTWGAGARL